MQAFDSKVFKIVAGVHVALVICVVGFGFLQGCFQRPPDRVMPVEFLVDVRPPVDQDNTNIPEDDPVTPEPEPEPAPVPDTPEPEPAHNRRIQVNTNRVIRKISQRPDPAPQSPTPLSAEEIQRLLDEGAQASDRTVVPDADGKGLAMIRRTLYSIWDTPSRAAVGDAEVTLKISLGAGGVVQSATVVAPSGNPVMDESVERVAKTIGRIHGLPAGFVDRWPHVTIAFSVE